MGGGAGLGLPRPKDLTCKSPAEELRSLVPWPGCDLAKVLENGHCGGPRSLLSQTAGDAHLPQAQKQGRAHWAF